MDADTMLTISELGRDVAVLRWPEQEDERSTLARLGLPRLLILDAATDPPPPSSSCLEDWARVPVEPVDLRARLTTLHARSTTHRPRPRLDPLGQCWHRGSCVGLSPTEERLVAILIDQFGDVVSDDDLVAAGWDGGDGSYGALRIHLTRLRRRLRPLGLVIKSKRGVGHVLRGAEGDALELLA